MGSVGAIELFFIAAITVGIGGDAMSRRIREQFNGSEQFKQAGLTLSTSYRSLGTIKRNPIESIETLLERVAARASINPLRVLGCEDSFTNRFHDEVCIVHWLSPLLSRTEGFCAECDSLF
jgi:hypothetical protein